jgi:hypothetical protein
MEKTGIQKSESKHLLKQASKPFVAMACPAIPPNR